MTTLLFSLVAAALLQPPPDSAAFARAKAYATSTDGQAVLVMHRGRIIHEAYMAGGRVSARQLLASGSKSFVGLATLAAVADGKVSLDAPVARYLPEWQQDPRKSRITVRQLLSLEGGLETGNPGTGCGGRGATWNDAVGAGTFAEPGTTFRYGPYPFIAMGAALERANGGETFDAYLARRILTPLGVTVEWRARCADGKPQLAGGAAMTARDWAIVGEFVRLGGVYRGQRLLPESLVHELFTPAHSNPSYGLSWWLVGATLLTQPVAELEGNAGGRRGSRGGAPGARAPRRTKANTPGSNAEATARPAWLPADLVMAAGMGKQRLYVIPSRELVIVRMGRLLGGQAFNDLDFLKPLLAPIG